MRQKSVILTAVALALGLVIYFGANKPPDPAGDIPNYFGVTESLKNHGSLELTRTDQANLEKSLHPEYFTNPIYYNITGRNGNKYSMHFVAYSVILTPLRMLFESIGVNPLNVFAVANAIFWILSLTVVLLVFKHIPWIPFFLLALLTPIMSFVSWPGPDVLYLSLLLLAVFFAGSNKLFTASMLAAFASWHSQPLIITAGLFFLWDLIKILRRNIDGRSVALAAIRVIPVILILSIPYLYNLWAFGILTPWTALKDGWTQTNGFGLQNISVLRFASQIFDPDIGILWYMPLALSIILAGLASGRKVRVKDCILTAVFFATAIGYQTNPAFHYGSAGLGPSRHSMFYSVILLFLASGFLSGLKMKSVTIIIIVIGFVSQIAVLSENNWLRPVFSKTFYHTNAARFILDHAPNVYNPIPEIFMDRTNHTDLDHLSTAVYQKGNHCQKAYVAHGDIAPLLSACQTIPLPAQEILRRNPKASFYVQY